MAEASARIRLSQEATVVDAERAITLTSLWRYALMGENYDETSTASGVKTNVRNKERIIRDIVSTLQNDGDGIVNSIDVYNEAEKLGIDRNTAETIIEKLVLNGTLMRPSLVDGTLAIV